LKIINHTNINYISFKHLIYYWAKQIGLSKNIFKDFIIEIKQAKIYEYAKIEYDEKKISYYISQFTCLWRLAYMTIHELYHIDWELNNKEKNLYKEERQVEEKTIELLIKNNMEFPFDKYKVTKNFAKRMEEEYNIKIPSTKISMRGKNKT